MSSPPATEPEPTQINFTSPESLTHIQTLTLTDVSTMTRLLHQCIAYQRTLDLHLDHILSLRPDLDKHLSSLQNSSDILNLVKSESDHMLSNVNSTCLLANQVSSKVRELDLAQSRVNLTLDRLDSIVERSNCIEGVQKALQAEDYESAASYVQTFLKIDAKYNNSGSEQREMLLEAKRRLEAIVRKRLGTAVDTREHDVVLRFIRLYAPLGLEEEGLQVYVGYLKKVISVRAVPQTTKFKYLGSCIQKDGELDADVAHRIQAGWCRWRAAAGVLCDRRFPTKLKGKFYRVAVRPAMLYGTDCWAIKKTQADKMEVAEMRMLRWMCGNTRLDGIRNEVFRERLGVARISDKIKEGRLRWFGHVKRRHATALVRSVENLTVEGKRRRGRPKVTWDEMIRLDLLELHFSEDMV